MNAYEKAQNQIEEAKRLLSDARAQLDALQRSAAVEASKPWEPKGGEYCLHPNGTVRDCPITHPSFVRAGAEYPTREAAESAAPYVTFFKRLCCLAAELDPSGKVGGHWYLTHPGTPGEEWEAIEWEGRFRNLHCVFQTKRAAEQAAKILSTDGWKVPSI